jgi:anti-sigma B factor antagonist
LNATFRVEAEDAATVKTVSVSGELDQATAPELRSTLTKAFEDGSPVIVDLSDCGFIDSTGLSVLVEAKRKLAHDEDWFGVCCPGADVRRLLALTGIDEAVGIFETRDEGITRLSAIAAS